MNVRLVLVLIALIIFLSINFVSASFQIGNKSMEIFKEYGGGEFLKGWINLSLQNEIIDSQLSSFESNINIINFLENSGSNFECVPSDCQSYYNLVTGSASSIKNFYLNMLEEKIVGLNFQGELKDNPIQSISFKLDSSVGSSCFQPLKIDILDDGEIEWRSFSSLNDFSCSVSQGCFNSYESLEDYNIGATPYCEKINVPYQPVFKVGADIIKGTTSGAEFKMWVYTTELNKLAECALQVNSSGESSCVVSLNLTALTDILVCINANKPTDYMIKGESIEPCGFYGLDYTEFSADYDIFAKGGKFAPVGQITIDENEFEKYNSGTLKDYINNYIYEKFYYNCSDRCTVPVKFISGAGQEVTLSNLQLSYDTKSGLKNENNFYEVKEEKAKVNMGFTKLDLKYANLSVPSSEGIYNAKLYLGEKLIGEEKIDVFASASIIGLNSQNIPAAVPYKIIVYTAGKNITSYKWDFGDNTAEQTTKNEVVHTYALIGEYNLKIEVTDSSGKKAVKNFLIKTISPKDFIKTTLELKRKNLNETMKDLNSVTAWYKEEIEKKASLDEIKNQLDSLETKYKSASTDTEYIAIMSNLTAIKVPYALNKHSSAGSFILNKEYVHPVYLAEITAREISNPEDYKDSIVNWFNENVDIYFDDKAYYLYYSGEQAHLLTSFVLKIKPKQDFSKETFLIIDKRYDEIKFKQDYKEKAIEDATAITFSELRKDEEKIIEFVLPEKIEIFDFPAYVSPEFSELTIENETISPCNNNGICEKEIDENSKNCPNDCKPWGKALIYWIILLFVAFAVYIALQEWYKRYYEKYLFKNKNDLFNLINFINNALHQKLSKDEIFKKLRPYGWKNEQIVYAFKKVQGKRTGMWEIPVFRWLEKRKIREEIEKRRKLGMIGIQYPPRYY